MKVLDINKYAVTKIGNQDNVTKVPKCWKLLAFDPSCTIFCMSPLLKCLFKYIFCIVTNISLKKQHHHMIEVV